MNSKNTKTRRSTKTAGSQPVAILCNYTKLVDPAILVEHPRNPNKHPTGQIAKIVKILKHQGWRSPIVVSNRSGFIVAGHGRLQAAQALAMTEVPVSYQDFDDEAQEWSHMIADNRVAQDAEVDDDKLKALLSEMDDSEFDRSLTGFDDSEIEKLLSAESEPPPDDEDEDPEEGPESQIRQIVLVMGIPDFERTMAQLEKIKLAAKVETDSEAAILAIMTYAKNQKAKK